MKYAARRLAGFVLTMLLVSLLTFAAFSLISGNPAQLMLGTSAEPEQVAALEEQLGLNRPLPVRYGEWLVGFVTGDLGTSYQYRQSVGALIAGKTAVTLALSLVSFILIVLVSLPLGVVVARYAGGVMDKIHTAVNQLCMALPAFFIGILLSWAFGVALKWFIPGSFPGLDKSFWGSMRHLFFAAVAIAVPRVAMTVRMLRSTILGEMSKDYVRTAIARGNDRGGVLWRHVLKNSLVPAVTFLGQTMAEIVAGSIVVEQVFGIPGLGRLLVSSISRRDYPVVQAIVVILAFWVVLSGTLADLINQRIDPRLRLGGAA